MKDLPAVLVIGGAGFVGFHLCQALLERDCFVYCLDKLTREKKANLLKIINKRNFHFLKASPKNPLRKLQFLDFNYIFYLGGLIENFWGITKFLELAKKQRAKFLLLSPLFLDKEREAVEILTSRYFSYYDLNVRIVRLIDVYGPRMSLKEGNEINSLFKNLKSKTIFKISGDGSKVLYPLFISDAVEGLLKAMFSQNSKGKVYCLGGEAVSILEFINVLKKESRRTLGIEFVASKERTKQGLRKKEMGETRKQLHWQTKTSLKEGIKKSLAWLNKFHLPKKRKKRKQFFSRGLLIFSLIIFSFLIFPLASLVFYYFQGAKELKRMRDSFSLGDLEKVEVQVATGLSSFQQGKKVLFNLLPFFSFFRLEKAADYLAATLDLGIYLTQAVDLTAETTKRIDKLTAIVIKEEKGDFYREREGLKFTLNQLGDTLSEIEASKDNRGFNKIKNQLILTKKKLELGREFIKILPDLLALEEKRVYLVILQNNLELRPTGGFIGSYGLLTFEKGKLLDFQIEKSEVADSQLKGQVEPPLPLKTYLGEPSWYFRDVNWDPHFPSSSAKAEWFLEKTINREVDGTIALNFYFIQRLLQVLGPVELEAGGESITQGNLLERAEYYSAQQRRERGDFLAQVVMAIFSRIKEMKEGECLKLIQAVNEALEEREILVALHDEETNRFFNQKGWDGAIREISLQENLLADYLMLVEANLSVDQVNYFIERQITQELTFLTEETIKEKTKLIYQNKSRSENPPGGNYKNYLRLYLPLAIELNGIFIGQRENNLQLLTDDKIDRFNEHNKQGVGFLVEIPVGEKRIVEINYQLNHPLIFKEQMSNYAFYWQKQSGIKTEPFNFKVNEDAENFMIIETKPQAEISSRGAIFESDTQKDRVFLIKFQKE
jgi:nucleoside-diphosphate-sugar epimerase